MIAAQLRHAMIAMVGAGSLVGGGASAAPLDSLTLDSPALPAPGVADRERAMTCLAAAIAYEAGFEPIEGQQAVAEVVLNRVRHPAYPKTVCGVVFSGSQRRTGCQFTFTCDGSLARRLPDAIMAASRRVAEAALDGLAPDRVGTATHYHADYVKPYWAPSLFRIAKIGAHIFYRMPGAGESRGVPIGIGVEPAIPGLDRFAGTRGPRPASPPQPPQSKLFAPWGLTPGLSRSEP